MVSYEKERAVPKHGYASGTVPAVRKKYPAIMAAYEALSGATAEVGPLNARAREMVRLALAIGAFREGAVHSHTRRALAEGCTPEEIRHIVLLATTTLGFPSMMAAMTWVEDILDGE